MVGAPGDWQENSAGSPMKSSSCLGLITTFGLTVSSPPKL